LLKVICSRRQILLLIVFLLISNLVGGSQQNFDDAGVLWNAIMFQKLAPWLLVEMKVELVVGSFI
jgi:hypothetical protein